MANVAEVEGPPRVPARGRSKRRRLSLKVKIAWSVGVVAVAILALQAAVQMVSIREGLRKSTEEHLETLVTRTAAELDDKLSARLAVLEKAATALPADARDPTAVGSFLQERGALLALFDVLFVFDPEGKMVADLPARKGGSRADVSDREYYRKITTTLRPYISEPVINKVTRLPIVIMLVPVLDRDGRLVAVLAGILNLYKSNVLGDLRNMHLGNAGYFYLFHPNRTVILHPENSRVLRELAPNDPVAAQVEHAPRGTLTGIDAAGTAAVFSYTRLRLTGWVLVAAYPVAEAEYPIQKMVKRTLLAAVLMVLLVLPLMWLVTQRFLRPLESLTGQIGSLAPGADGVMSQRIAVTGSKEVEHLVQTFNHFVAQNERAERDLHHARNFLQTVVDYLPVAVFAKDVTPEHFGQFKMWNRMSVDMFGPTFEQVLGKTDYDIFPKDQAAFFREADRRVIEGGRSLVVTEEPIDTAHGRRYLRTAKAPIYGEDGRPQLLLGISLDITEHRELQEQTRQRAKLLGILREGMEHYVASRDLQAAAHILVHGLVDVTGSGFGFAGEVVCDDIGQSTLTLHALTDVSGLDFGGGENQPPESGASLLQKLDALVAPALRTGRPYFHRQAEGAAVVPGVRTFLAVPIFYGDSIVGLYGLANRSEDYDQTLVEFLAPVASSYAALIESGRADARQEQMLADLTDARNRAEAANRAKSEFLAVMSHEIRTPLNGVLGMTQLTLETEVTGEQREYLELALSSANGLLTIINDILDLSRVDAGKLELDAQPFELRNVVDEVLRIVALRVQEKGLALNLSFAAEVPQFVIGDAARVRQVLLNLVGNAIKFTTKGSVDVRVSRVPTGYDRVGVLFAVSDTGIGIPADKLAKIFEAFSQADRSITRRFGGTGLGLAIAKRLVELMGGAIDVESEEGRGSTFRVTVHFGEVAAKNDPLVRGAGGDEVVGPRPTTRPLQVLLVEDNPVNQVVAAGMLERLGHQLSFAGNGWEAVEAVDRESFDLILMDLEMPVMGGFEATRILRERGCKLPIIALTANAIQGIREQCLAAGMDDYLTKPVSLDALAIKIAAQFQEPATA